MKEEITIKLITNNRGEVVALFSFPDKRESLLTLCKFGEVWHIRGLMRDIIEAWLAAANKIHLTAAEIRRLRKNGVITFPAPDVARMKKEWQRIHTRNKGMTQRFNMPNLANV